MVNEVTYTLHIKPAEDGGYIAFFPSLPGCHTQGETLDEVILMAKDALAGYLTCLQKHGDPIPVEKRHPSKQVGFDVPLSLALAR